MSMAHTTLHARFPRHLFSRFAIRFTWARRGRLDPRLLSDHLQRDIGFLDGRKTPSEVFNEATDDFPMDRILRDE